MTALIVLTVVLVVAQTATGVVWWRSRRPSSLQERIRRRVIVTTKSGEAFAGVLFQADAAAVVLRDATAYGLLDDGSNLVVDGEALLLLADVAYVQFP